MNCPLCSEPMLFGATSCPCGYNPATAASEELPIELSYWEALRVFWRVYWPTQVVDGVLILLIAVVATLVLPRGSVVPPVPFFLVQVAINAAVLYLFVPRICSRPFRGFSLVIVGLASGAITTRLRSAPRRQVWLFLWWRQILAGLLAGLMAMPLNAVLGIMGVQCSPWIAILGGVLVVGPILLKMLIGQQFEEFRLEARRRPENVISTQPASVPAHESLAADAPVTPAVPARES